MLYRGVRYRISEKGAFFPHSRAHGMLSRFQGTVATIEQFIDYLYMAMPIFVRDLEFIEFYDFERYSPKKVKNDGFRFRVAQLFTVADPYVRDAFYEAGARITANTGWYPLVTGSRAWLNYRDYAKSIKHGMKFNIGALGSLSNVAANEGGQSILLQGTNGGLLLDAGFGVRQGAVDSAKVVFASHFHGDHLGGLGCFVGTKKPLIISEPALASMWAVPGLEGGKCFSKRIYLAEEYARIPDNFFTFPVFHSPGSHGCVYRDDDGTAVVYPGDICLRNRFLDHRYEFLDFVLGIAAKSKWVLLDAALVGNKDPLLNEDKSIDEFLNDNFYDSGSNLALVAESPELLVYTYLSVFYRTNTRQKMIVNYFTHVLLKRLWSYVMKNSRFRDPVVNSARNSPNFAESQRLYWVSSLPKLDPRERLIMFLSSRDLLDEQVLQRLASAKVVLLGKYALNERAFDEYASVLSSAPVRVATPDWSFHSRETDILWLIRRLSANGVNTVLFHNYPGRLAKFLRQNRLDSSLVQILRHTPISINQGMA